MSRMRLASLSLFLAASIARADDAAAQELYKKVSDAFMAAKTVHVKEARTSASDKKGMTFNMSSDVWLASENRLSFKAKVEVGGGEEEVHAISDGKVLALFEGGNERQRGDAAPELAARSRSALMGGGVMPAMSIMDEPAEFKDGGTSDFQAVVEGKVGERAANVLEYTYHFTAGGDEVSLGVKLYVDKETNAILKREATDPKEGLTIDESYAAVELDAAAPDDAFVLPAQAEPGTGSEENPQPPADEQPK